MSNFIEHSVDWHKYNLAKTQEKRMFYELLHELCQIIPEHNQGKGRPTISISDLIFSLGLKIYSNYSGRRISSDLKLAQLANYISKSPHYNTLNDFLNCPATYELLRKLLTISAMPLKELEDFYSMDSSGFGSYQYERWRRVKYSRIEESFRNFLKGHICIGTRTNVICSCEITKCYDSSDVGQAPKLLESLNANFKAKEITGDKAYSSKRLMQIIESMGAIPFIVFKDNTNPNKRSPRIWNKMYSYFVNNKELFMKSYHRRSNVETTFSMIKLKLGEFLRCKNFESQRNELIMKFIVHNITCLISEIFENNIHIDFKKCLDEYNIPQPIIIPEPEKKPNGHRGMIKF